jgi:glucuronate isomerase
MQTDALTAELLAGLEQVPLIDPHSHIDPHRPVSRHLDDILGYHYYTELAHSAGLPKPAVAPDADPRERVRAVLGHMDRYDNTAQYGWFLDIARTFLGFEGDRVTAADADALCDAADRTFNAPGWEAEVFRKTNLEAIFLTNEFDDPLAGFDTARYVPCLRTDALVFQLDRPDVRKRLASATGVEVGDYPSLRRALGKLFEHFTSHGAKACAISLPPRFQPEPISHEALTFALGAESVSGELHAAGLDLGVFWLLAEMCREHALPFDLMIGVNRRVYRDGVFQGQDLFDSRCSLIQYAELFNAFPDVTFCVSVLSSGLNQELASYSWIFPNVVTSGHWWYSNIPAYIELDTRARLQAVPKTKQIGYYSDAYKLEFVLPKFAMYRRTLARVLADDFVRTGRMKPAAALELGRLVLRDNVRTIFRV